MSFCPRLSLSQRLLLTAGVLLASGMAHAQDGFVDSLQFLGVDITYTSGTTVLQRVHAKEASVSPDGRSILAKTVRMEATGDQSDDVVTVNSAVGRYYHSAPETGREPEEAPPAVTDEDVIAIREETSTEVEPPNPHKQDLLLTGEDMQGVVAEVGERGTLRAPRLYWSQWHERFIAPQGFVQEAVAEDGGVVQISGDVCITDQSFTDWVYYSFGGNNPGVISFESKDESAAP